MNHRQHEALVFLDNAIGRCLQEGLSLQQIAAEIVRILKRKLLPLRERVKEKENDR